MGAARAETGAKPGMVVGRQPASIGRLRAGSLETRVKTGLADRLPGTPRKQWAGGQGLRRCPFYAGFGAGVVAGFKAGVVVIGKVIEDG